MNQYRIQVGQVYCPADGSKCEVVVIDTSTYAKCGDVVIRDSQGKERRIDAFKLAMVRYSLKD